MRQLEAIIRLSESLAKMRLRDEVTSENVDEAHRLFEVSTMKSIEGRELGVENSPALASEIRKIEEIIKKKVCMGHQITITKLMDDMDSFPRTVLERAIMAMVKNGDLKQMRSKKVFLREK